MDALRDRVEKHLRSYLILSGGHGLSVRWWLWRRVRGGLSHDDGQVCISALSALCRMLRVPAVSLPSFPLLCASSGCEFAFVPAFVRDWLNAGIHRRR